MDSPQTAAELAQMFDRAGQSHSVRIEAEIVALEEKIADIIHGLLPRCQNGNCGSADIRYRVSSHFVRPDHGVVGPGWVDSRYHSHVDYLYCGTCGFLYWKEGAEEIVAICEKIKVQRSLLDSSNL